MNGVTLVSINTPCNLMTIVLTCVTPYICTGTPSSVTEHKHNESSLLHLKTEADCFHKFVSVCVFSDKRKSPDNVSDVLFVSVLL